MLPGDLTKTIKILHGIRYIRTEDFDEQANDQRTKKISAKLRKPISGLKVRLNFFSSRLWGPGDGSAD